MGQNRSALAPFKPLEQTFMSLNKVSMEALLATWVGGGLWRVLQGVQCLTPTPS